VSIVSRVQRAVVFVHTRHRKAKGISMLVKQSLKRRKTNLQYYIYTYTRRGEDEIGEKGRKR
jgi:hypothetical protein